MNILTMFPIIILSLLIGIGAKQYEHSYHTGLVGLMRVPPDLPHGGSARLQLDFTINPKSDSIFGRFQAIDLPTTWKQVPPAGTFSGKITRLNGATRSFGGHYTTFGVQGERGFDWEAVCDFDNLGEQIWISKMVPNKQGHDHFRGFVGNGKAFLFNLE